MIELTEQEKKKLDAYQAEVERILEEKHGLTKEGAHHVAKHERMLIENSCLKGISVPEGTAAFILNRADPITDMKEPMSLEEYKRRIVDCLLRANNDSMKVVKRLMVGYEKIIPASLEENYPVSVTATMINFGF